MGEERGKHAHKHPLGHSASTTRSLRAKQKALEEIKREREDQYLALVLQSFPSVIGVSLLTISPQLVQEEIPQGHYALQAPSLGQNGFRLDWTKHL